MSSYAFSDHKAAAIGMGIACVHRVIDECPDLVPQLNPAAVAERSKGLLGNK